MLTGSLKDGSSHSCPGRNMQTCCKLCITAHLENTHLKKQEVHVHSLGEAACGSCLITARGNVLHAQSIQAAEALRRSYRHSVMVFVPSKKLRELAQRGTEGWLSYEYRRLYAVEEPWGLETFRRVGTSPLPSQPLPRPRKSAQRLVLGLFCVLWADASGSEVLRDVFMRCRCMLGSEGL